MIKYLFFLIIPLFIIPSAAYATTFTDTTSDSATLKSTVGAYSDCASVDFASRNVALVRQDMGEATNGAEDCEIAQFIFDTTALPDAPEFFGKSMSFEFDVLSTSSPLDCKITAYTDYPRTNFKEYKSVAEGTSLLFAAASARCDSAATGITVTLDDPDDVAILYNIARIQNEIVIHMNADPFLRTSDGFSHDNRFVDNDAILTIEYDLLPDAVTTLTAVDIRGSAVDLSWIAPSMNGGILRGFAINNTTPHNTNVATVIQENTSSTLTTATVSGLLGSTDYSFRVAALSNQTGAGQNTTGAFILNVTTTLDPTQDFTAGTLNFTQTGTDVRNFKFERVDINDTALRLNVTYSNTFDVDCNFYYKFAMTNDTFTSIADTAISTSEDEASFLFLDVDNEIIDVACIDKITATNGTYLITQTSFPILDQIADFRAGEFGTDGNFGVIDFITLSVILISMVGFNRVNPSVGVIFSVIIIGAFSVFEVIPWESTFTASIALVIMWAVTTTRKA